MATLVKTMRRNDNPRAKNGSEQEGINWWQKP
jgi:hypothetical protein